MARIWSEWERKYNGMFGFVFKLVFLALTFIFVELYGCFATVTNISNMKQPLYQLQKAGYQLYSSLFLKTNYFLFISYIISFLATLSYESKLLCHLFWSCPSINSPNKVPGILCFVHLHSSCTYFCCQMPV